MRITRITYWTDDGQSQNIEGERVAARAASVFELLAEQEGHGDTPNIETAGSHGAKWAREGNDRLDHEPPPKPPTVLWTGHLPSDPTTVYRVVVKINVDDDDEDAFGRMFLEPERQGRDAMGDCCWQAATTDRVIESAVIEAALLSLAQDLGLVAP